jgi:uncharacterized phage protein gp47/JayE
MSFDIKGYNSILQDMQTWIIANQDKITDFNEGGVLASELEAFARQIEQLYVRTKLNFSRYFLEVPYAVFDLSRKEGLRSSGTVVFSRDSADTEVVDIPAGTKVSTETGISFYTTEAGEIASAATDSAAVDIQSSEVGTESNVPADTITVVPFPILGVDSVTNANPTTGGQDSETDIEFLQRFREYLLGLGGGSKYGVISAAKGINGVRSASIVEHFPPMDDTYNFTLYIDDGAGDASSDLVDEVEDLIEGDGTADNPGVRAPGVQIRYIAPTKVTVNVTATVDLSDTVAEVLVESLVETAITDHINGLNIGDDVIVSRLIETIMNQPGVSDVSVSAPSTNTTISDAQIARVGTISLTFT